MKKLSRISFIRYFTGLLVNLNLTSILLLFQGGLLKFRRYIGLSNKLYFYLNNESYVPSMNPYDIFSPSNKAKIKIIPFKSEVIETRIDELAFLALITALTNPSVIFEIGTFRGRTALNFALNSREDCIIYTLDLPRNDIDTSTLGKADIKLL